jgi:fatty-acid desaturase
MKHHRDAYLLLFLHSLAYIGLGSLIIYGTGINWITALVMFFVFGCLGANVTFHRLLSHRSWSSPEWFKVFGTLAGTMAMIGSSIAWVSLHHNHHRHTDREGDPHSPKDDLLTAYLGGIFVEPSIRRVPHLLRDPLHLFLHKHYFKIHFTVLAILLLISPMLAVSLYLAPAAMVLIVGGLVNILGHTWGYRNYETDDLSRNNIILGYLMWGEGWHNNHHAEPTSLYLGRKWWEIDIGGCIINLLKR